LAGADKAGKEAIRPVLALLKKAYGDDFQIEKFIWLLERIEPDSKKIQVVCQQLEREVNTISTSSLGRVFDAVAAMAGLGSYNHFEAQLPMALEAIVENGVEENYDFELIKRNDEPLRLDLSEMVKRIIADIQKGLSAGTISAKFHNTLAIALLAMAKQARESKRLDTVALSGGVFCNRYLSNRLIKLLKENGFFVLFNSQIPANDGGISVGQAAIAAKAVTRAPSLVARS
jgi:hydrogenase maturation protein HypF